MVSAPLPRVFPVLCPFPELLPTPGGLCSWFPPPALPAPLREGIQPSGHGGGWGILGDTGLGWPQGMWRTAVTGFVTPKQDSPTSVRAVPSPSTLRGAQPGPDRASTSSRGCGSLGTIPDVWGSRLGGQSCA